MAKRPQTTPTLTELIRRALDEAFANVNISMPGTIESFDPATGLADVRPGFKRVFVDGDNPDIPIIGSVPVVFPGSGAAFVRFPVKKGDTVLLQFSQRSIDQWTEKGGQVDPIFDGRFQLSDAVAIVGLRWKGNALVANGGPDSVELANGQKYIEITDDGFIINDGSEELIDLISQFIGIMQTATIASAGFDPPTPVDLTTLKTKVDAMKG